MQPKSGIVNARSGKQPCLSRDALTGNAHMKSVMGYTAMLGGQVRHTEVRTGNVCVPVTQENPD